MEYRIFGKTGLNLSVVTLGGMRYPKGWDKIDDALPVDEAAYADSYAACLDTTRRALDMGINHIETAKAYGISERLYGRIFKDLNIKPGPDGDFFLMTKGDPPTYDDAMRMIETQLRHLGVDRFDLYAWHGVNNRERYAQAIDTGPTGAMRALTQLRDQGVIGHIGFSTHGALDVIMDTIATDLFDFVNLHFYYFFQRNFPAVAQAGLKKMGVFIISPNDKGGQLFSPSQKVADICGDLSPLAFNARFCLSHAEVHTMTFGFHEPHHFDPVPEIFNDEYYLSPEDRRIKHALDRQIETLGKDYCTVCGACLPCPEEINIPEVLRFRNMWKAYDMEEFGKYRYNMLEEKGHWFPGRYGSACTDCGDCLPRCPAHLDIPALLRETHAGLYQPKDKKN